MRPEHLEGLMRRLAANERILQMMKTDQLIDIIYEYIDTAAATKIEEMYKSLSADKGEFIFDDFRDAVNEVFAPEETLSELPEHIQYQVQVCLDYLFPPPRPF